jgi:hypothetical protein
MQAEKKGNPPGGRTENLDPIYHLFPPVCNVWLLRISKQFPTEHVSKWSITSVSLELAKPNEDV